MIKGEYRGASLGWLVVVLVLLGGWALIWGPDDGGDGFELANGCLRTTPGSAFEGDHPTWTGDGGGTTRLETTDYPEPRPEVATYPVIAPQGAAAFALCLRATEPVTVTAISVADSDTTLTATVISSDGPRPIAAEPLGEGPALVIDLWASADHCGDGWTASAADIELVRSGSQESHRVGLNGAFVFEPDRSLCTN